ncbi:MAG: hypothetical protein V3T08_10190 [Gemmatimonadota bacterium]
MPRLFQHGRTLRRLINRWRISDFTGARARLFEIPSWVQTIIRVDRDWDDDERQVWGYTADSPNNSLATNFPAVAMNAGSREVHVRKIQFMMNADNGAALVDKDVNILTPPSGYNAVLLAAGEFFPFLQTTPTVGVTAPLSLPAARVIGGHQTGLMIVTIGGVPINPAIGPRYRHRFDLVGVTPSEFWVTILDWSDPPLIVPPFRQLAVQLVNPSAGVPERLFVNYWISERDAA